MAHMDRISMDTMGGIHEVHTTRVYPPPPYLLLPPQGRRDAVIQNGL